MWNKISTYQAKHNFVEIKIIITKHILYISYAKLAVILLCNKSMAK